MSKRRASEALIFKLVFKVISLFYQHIFGYLKELIFPIVRAQFCYISEIRLYFSFIKSFQFGFLSLIHPIYIYLAPTMEKAL